MSHSETSINEEHNDKIDESENITIEEWIEDEDRQAEDFIEVDGIVDESNIGQEIVLNSEDDQILRQEDAGVSMIDDNAMMPIKTTAELTLNLPDLMSRVITFSNGSNMYLCFSKRCRRQISFDGYLYTIDGYLNVSGWNVWRCANPFCSGSVRTAPNFEELRLRTDHVEGCQADDTQVRLRITVYDLRLMSEFTEIPLNALYQAYLDKVMTEHPDIVHLFPPFETMKSTLEDHRKNNIYRKRFEMESREADTVMIESYSVAGQPVKFRRTKLFPPSLCMECAVEFRSSPDVPSHDQLVDHLFVAHDRSHAIIEQYTFSESSLFEQWIRDLQYHSRHRMKKMGLHDEHMYYLCQGDDRLFKSNHGRTALGGLHCSAFIRVHDWRLVMRRDVSEVVVDFCLEHSFHSGETPLPENVRQPVYDYFSPEVFMRELEQRRERTQRIIQDGSLQRIKRTARGMSPASVPMKKPRLSQYTCTNSGELTLVDQSGIPTYYEDYVEPELSTVWIPEGDGIFGEQRSCQRQEAMRQLQHGAAVRSNTVPNISEKKTRPVPFHITKRSSFADSSMYNHVLQLELQCDMLKERMQSCRSVRAAKHYLGRVTNILDDVMADPRCAPAAIRQMDRKSLSSSGAQSLNEYDIDKQACPPHTTEESRETQGNLQACQDGENVEVSPMVQASSSHFGGLVTNGQPVRQKVFVRRGKNGQMVVVKRTIVTKVRKVVRCVEPETGKHEAPLGETNDPYLPIESASTNEKTMEPIVVDDEHSNNQRQTTVGNDSELNRTVGDVLREALGSRYRRTPRTEVKKEQPSSLVSFRSPSPPPVDVKLFNSEEISRQTREQSFIPHSGSAPTRRGWVKSRSNAHFDRFLSGIVASLGEEAFMETAGSERISSPQEEIETINNKPAVYPTTTARANMSVHGTTPIRRGRGRPRKHPLPGNT